MEPDSLIVFNPVSGPGPLHPVAAAGVFVRNRDGRKPAPPRATTVGRGSCQTGGISSTPPGMLHRE